jgi:hypothetical protein
MNRSSEAPPLRKTESNCPFCGSAAGCVHDQKVLPYSNKPPVLTGTLKRLEQRIGVMKREKKRILEGFEAERANRLARARSIARALAEKNGKVTLYDVHDAFIETSRDLTWEDENGRTYWAGAVFRQKGWTEIGRCESPYNHNDQNKVWKWEGE